MVSRVAIRRTYQAGLVLSVAVVFVLAGTVCKGYQRPEEIAAILGAPPLPDYDSPVDYIAWTNQQLGEGMPYNASRTFESLIEADRASRTSSKIYLLTKPLEDRAIRASTDPLDESDPDIVLLRSLLPVYRSDAMNAAWHYLLDRDPAAPRTGLGILHGTNEVRDAMLLDLVDARRTGQTDALISAWNRGLRTAHLYEQNVGMIVVSIGSRIRRIVLQSVHHWIASSTVDTDDLDALGEMLGQTRFLPPRFDEVARLEWGTMLSVVQYLYPGSWGDKARAETFGIVLPFRPAPVVEEIDRRFGQVVLALRGLALREATVYLLGRAAEPAEKSDTLHSFLAKFAETSSLGGVATKRLLDESALHATELIVALHRHKVEYGQFPRALTDVFDEAAIRDPISDRPYVYEVKDGGENFALRSAGLGGPHSETAFWTKPSASTLNLTIEFWPPRVNE